MKVKILTVLESDGHVKMTYVYEARGLERCLAKDMGCYDSGTVSAGLEDPRNNGRFSYGGSLYKVHEVDVS